MTSENFALLWCGLLLETQLGKQGNEGRTDIDTCTEKLGLGRAVLCPVEQHQLESSACLTMLHEEKGSPISRGCLCRGAVSCCNYLSKGSFSLCFVYTLSTSARGPEEGFASFQGPRALVLDNNAHPLGLPRLPAWVP